MFNKTSRLQITDLEVNTEIVENLSQEELQQISGGLLPALMLIGWSLVADWYIAEAIGGP